MSTSWLQTFPLLAGYAVVFGFCVGKAFQYTVRIMTPTDKICVLFSCLRVTDCDIVGRVSGSQQTVQLVRTDQHVSGHRHFHRSSSGRCPFKRRSNGKTITYETISFIFSLKAGCLILRESTEQPSSQRGSPSLWLASSVFRSDSSTDKCCTDERRAFTESRSVSGRRSLWHKCSIS